MKQWFGTRETSEDKQLAAAQRLRYAMIGFLDETDGDFEYGLDVVELAEHDWGIVNG